MSEDMEIGDNVVYRFLNSEGRPTQITVNKDLKDLFDRIDDLWGKNWDKREGGLHSRFWLMDRLREECKYYQRYLADHMTELWRDKK